MANVQCCASHAGLPACCCEDFVFRPFNFPEGWPGTAVLRARGGGDTTQKSTTKISTVIHNAKRILTVSDTSPQDATAIAVSEAGTIVALGKDAEILALAGDGVERVDLGQKSIIPGLVDVHTHPVMAAVGQYVIHDVSMFRCKTTDDVLAKIKQVHESTPGNEMLAFQGFNHSMQSPTKEFLTRDDLNKISKDRPLVVTHNTGHFCIVNDAAFKMAGMESEDTQDYPAGGHFQRDSTGRRTGVCEESLSIEFMKFQAQPGPEDMAKFIGLMLDEFAKKGLTTVAEAWAVGISEVEKALALYELVEGSGGMGTRLGFHAGTLQTPGPKDLMPLLKAKGYTQSVPGAPVFSPASPSNGHLLSVSGIKMVSDASGQGKTAFVTEPYNNPLPGNPVGSMNFPTPEILAKFQEIKAAGFSPMVHAIGDKAQDVVMDCFETIWGDQEVYGKEGANWRLRLEHMTVSREEQNPRMKRLGVFPSYMSSFYYWLGDFCHDEVFGPHLKTRITPWGSAQRHEICWNPHSDTPVVPIQPIRDWSVLISRKTAKGNVFSPEQGVERMQALKALTLNGATALGLEKITGSLEVAKFADLVVLDGDPVECSVEELGELRVAETWLVGKRRVW